MSYAASSVLTSSEREALLALETALGATPTGLVERPTFFDGFVAQPPVVAAGLLTVADVASTKYFDLSALRQASLDPVVTASGDRLRFESLSGCNGVYARFDLLHDGIDSGTVEFGTTNVDVNQPVRAALATVDRSQLLHVAVGAEALRVATLDATHVERKVSLPDRWVRGLAEVPAVSSSMSLVAEVSGAVARTFLGGLPRGAPGRRLSLAVSARGLVPVSASHPGSVVLAGTARLSAARRVMQFVSGLSLFASPSGESGWVFSLPGARLTLLLTAEPYRGFSGEGGLLASLAVASSADAEVVRQQLAWEPAIDPAWLSSSTGLPPERVAAALAVLATSGRVGFDLTAGMYFHRELPLEAERMERDNPRLVAARELVSSGLVELDGSRWKVGTSWVSFSPTSCTCLWWARYGGGRGPCKHVLAASLVAGPQQ